MNELKLRDDVMDELAYEPSVEAAHIGVAVDQNTVTLTGHVSSYAQNFAAIAAVRRVKGVRGIADEIEVVDPAQALTSDEDLLQRAVNMLAWESVVPAEAIQVTVHSRLVTLTGKVNWEYQKSSAERSIRRLASVRAVIKNIEIEPHAKAEDVKGKIEAALKRHAEVEAKNICVTVRDDSDVLLEGEVQSWDEKVAVEKAAWSAPGVKNVKDQLTIVS